MRLILVGFATSFLIACAAPAPQDGADAPGTGADKPGCSATPAPVGSRLPRARRDCTNRQ